MGGWGASLAEGFEVVSIDGHFALAVPLAEMLIAGWLLVRAGIALPAGAITPMRLSMR